MFDPSILEIFEKSKRHDYMHNIKVIYIIDSDICQVILVVGSLKTFFLVLMAQSFPFEKIV